LASFDQENDAGCSNNRANVTARDCRARRNETSHPHVDEQDQP